MPACAKGLPVLGLVALLGATPALAQDPTVSVDGSTGLAVAGQGVGFWTGIGVQAHVPIKLGHLVQLGGRIQYAGGWRTSFLSLAPMIAIKGEVVPRFSLFADLSADAAIELANPGIAPHARLAGGFYVDNQGFFLFGEVFGRREWRADTWTIGVGYANDFL